MSLLVARDLGKSFDGVVAARGVALSLERAELLALIGPNGAGKTTTFNMLGGQLPPDRGHILLDGADITSLTPRERFRRGVGRTFQIARTFRSMTAAENVQMGLIGHHGRTRALLPEARRLYRDAALDLLDRVRMAEAADRPCAALAYGDVKRVELAVALAGEPKLLLMDEPTAGMAPRERTALMELTRSLARAQGIGVLFTEHDMTAVFGFADRVVVMVRGAIIAEGSPEAVRADPEVKRAYLGETGAAAALAADRTQP